jgi:hypothetical protein
LSNDDEESKQLAEEQDQIIN